MQSFYSSFMPRSRGSMGIFIAIVIAIAIYFLGRSQGWWGNKEENEESPPSDGYVDGEPVNNIPVDNKPKPASFNVDKWLKTGSSGEEVKQLQRNLDRDIQLILMATGRKLNPIGAVDGKFGQKTKDALWNLKCVVETSLRRYDQLPFKKC